MEKILDLIKIFDEIKKCYLKNIWLEVGEAA